MLRQIFNSPNKLEVWRDTKVVPKQQENTLCMASLSGLTDGLIMGFVIGGVLGIMQGWVSDAKAKELCILSSSWALNGAAIGALALGIGNALFHSEMGSSGYSMR